MTRCGQKDIVFVGADGIAVGDNAPSSEWRFHRDILLARPEMNAVVHTHSRYATILSILGKEIPAVHYMIAAAGGHTIRVAPYALYGTQELSDHVVKALQNRKACLMDHHGMIAVGATLEKAMWLATEVETLAAQHHGCLTLGTEAPDPVEKADSRSHGEDEFWIRNTCVASIPIRGSVLLRCLFCIKMLQIAKKSTGSIQSRPVLAGKNHASVYHQRGNLR